MNSPDRIQRTAQSFSAADSPKNRTADEEESDEDVDRTQEECIEDEDERNAVQAGIDFDTPDPDADDPVP